MKQFSSLMLFVAVLFIAAVLYLLTKPPGDVTLKEILKVNPPPANAHAPPEEPERRGTPLLDSVKKVEDYIEHIDYFIIVESVKNRDLAQQKAKELKNGIKTDIIVLPPTKEGNYRISYGKYSSLDEAKLAIEYIRKNIRSDAWIFSVKK
jgi:SPOR domain